jgi:histidinol-phosphatase (PHP family)
MEDDARAAAAPPGDYHIHTAYSDGDDSVEDCVRRAVALGLPEVGIADHVSGVRSPDWDLGSIPFERLDDYVAEVLAAAARHDDITVLLGVEADYLPGHEDELAELLAAYPFQYVVGGVHVIDGFDFDNPDRRDDPRWSDPDALFTANYRAVRAAAECARFDVAGAERPRFDVIAHLDYVGLWGHTAGPAADPTLDAALDAMAAYGCAIELNTDRVSDPAGVMYPSQDILRRARARRIPLVVSSDAHRAEHVGRLWNEAIALARRAGYTKALRLSDKKLVPLP